jgi:hypothetical protein
MSNPKLIDNMTKSFLCHSLYTCHEKRIRYYSTALNIIVLLSFLGIFGSALYLCYNKQESAYDKYRKNLKDQEFILDKIRHYETIKSHELESITNLPNIYSPVFTEKN